jgi:peptidoglycan/LPS O-acetylase OafA/YrhL
MSDWDGRENNFDFMRLSLAVLVIYSHAYALGLGSEALEPVVRATHGQISGGVIAVDSFFVMSGFLITASAERSRGVGTYLKKRVARIYPAFLVAMILSALIVLPLSGGTSVYAGWWARVADFLLQTLRMREFSYKGAFMGNPYPGTINGSTWSVPYEFWCYIGVALLMLAGWLRRRGLMLGLFAASWVIGILFQWRGWILGGKQLGLIVGPPQLWARMLPFYLAGVVFYLYRGRIPLRGWIAAVSVLSLVAASWLPLGWTAMFPLAGTYLVFWFAFTPWVKLHRVGRFGDFSYGTYLYAFPIEQMVVKGFGHAVAPVTLFAIATPITLGVAVGSWYGVERWFLAPIRRKDAEARA